MQESNSEFKGLPLSFTARKTTSILATTAVALLLLTGCAGGQSKVEACTILTGGLQPLGTAITDAAGDLTTDPEGASADMSAAAEAFEAEVKKITNEDVKPPSDAAAASVTAFADAVATVAADPETADFTLVSDTAADVQTKVTALGTVCS